MTSHIHFITYGDDKYKQSRERICQEAKDSNWFYTVKYYTNNDYDEKFYNKNKVILDIPKGGGYWVWKPYFIKKHLKEELKDNDVLVYVDSGCSINKENKEEFNRYIDIVKNHNTGIIGFQYTNLFYQEKMWNIQETFDYFKVTNTDIMDTPQICGGIQIIHKKPKAIEIIDKWYNVIEDNILLFTDFYNNKQTNHYFKDNRHDQSIQSVIKKIYKVPIIQNHGMDSMNGIDPKNNSAPFTASRIRC